MNSHIIFLSVCALAGVAANAAAATTLRDRFDEWLVEFRVDLEGIRETYGKDDESCFGTWVRNHKFIIENNLSENSTVTLGHNKFSFLETNEFSKFMGFKQVSDIARKGRRVQEDPIPESKLPASWDWRTEGAVTEVKDQGQCGSCWSFSATGALEGAYQIKTGELKSFSEQQLVSCDNRKNKDGHYTDMGCNGGMMDSADNFISDNDGLCTEEDYPYVSGDTKENEDCIKTCTEDIKSDIESYVDVTPNSDEALMNAIYNAGPVSIAIQADQKKFQLYSSGVLQGSECGDSLDHGVLVVGWGTEDNTPYWIVKNSWATTWGDEGYIKLERGTDANGGTGTCGILSIPSYPILFE